MMELCIVGKLWVVLAQAVYWFALREDDRDQVVWEACLYPGREESK